MNMVIIIVALLIGLVLVCYFTSPTSYKLKLNQVAPDFSLLDQDNKMRHLSDFKGHKVVVYFYPKADTPGCTKEACSIRDGYAAYKDNNIIVLGISYDLPKEQKAFQEKYHLPFILLSDNNKEAAKAYGAYQSFINILFPARKTFLINEQGRIVKIFDKVDVENHSSEILEAFGIKHNL